MMRAIPIAAITFAGLLLSSIGAQADGTWCAHYGSNVGTTARPDRSESGFPKDSEGASLTH